MSRLKQKQFVIKIPADQIPAGARPWAAIVRLTPAGEYQLTHALYFAPENETDTRLVLYNAWPRDVVRYGISGSDDTRERWYQIIGEKLEPIPGRAGACKIWGRWPAAGATMGPMDLVGHLGTGNGRRVEISHGVPRVSSGGSELVRCDACSGTGRAPSSTRLNWQPCLTCHGRGIL